MRHALIALALLVALASPAAAVEQELTIYLHEYTGGLHIAPEVIHARVGDVLKVTVVNAGATPHNLVFCGDGTNPMEKCDESWGRTAMIPPNGTAPLTVDVKKAGTFDYYCYIAGHKGARMTGQLIVQGDAEEKSLVPLGPLALLALGAAALVATRGRRA